MTDQFSPTVVVSSGENNVPKWFYFVFGLTVIVFFVVTGLLIMQITQKSKPNGSQPTPTITQSASIRK